MAQQEPNVGQRIRLIRERRGLSLRALAEQCALSVNAISLIERGETSPTVSSLHILATTLCVPINEFFKNDQEQQAVFVPGASRGRFEANGVTLESLGSGLPHQQLGPFLITVAPGAGTMDQPVSHSGEEFVHCLTGEIEYCLEKKIYKLTEGDSFLFQASIPHCFRNSTEAPAQLILIYSATEDFHLAHRLHMKVATQPT